MALKAFAAVSDGLCAGTSSWQPTLAQFFTSIGSKSKARKHLMRAVELSPEYPTNHLTLMEAYLRWKETDELHAAMQRYRKLIPTAKEMYSGPRWENSWKTWEKDWKALLEKSRELFE